MELERRWSRIRVADCGGLGGTRQIVTITQAKIVGVDATTGALLWERPYPSPSTTNAVTPVLYGQTLIVSGNGGPTMAFTVTKQNNQWTTETVWENADIPYRLSNSVLVGDALFGLTSRNTGQYFNVDAKTGRRYGPQRRAKRGMRPSSGPAISSSACRTTASS